MRLCSFAVATPLGPLRRIGLATPQGILDATAARAAFLERRLPATAAQRIAAAEVPPDMLAFLDTGPLAMEWLAEAAEAVLGAGIAVTADGQTLLHEPDAAHRAEGRGNGEAAQAHGGYQFCREAWSISAS